MLLISVTQDGEISNFLVEDLEVINTVLDKCQDFEEINPQVDQREPLNLPDPF